MPLTPVTFSLDLPLRNADGEVQKPWGTQIEFAGWAHTGPVSGNSGISLEFTDTSTCMKIVVPCQAVERPDVIGYLGDATALRSGFHLFLNSLAMGPGQYFIGILLVNGETTSRIGNVATLSLLLHEFELAARVGLAAKFLRGSGIEIGALQRKLMLPEGCKVRYVDRLPLDALLLHYPELAGLPLQAPEIIDDGEKLDTITDTSQDFVVANHFLEHSRNPIQTLFNLARTLKPGGVLYMAVPDKRYTKDAPRPVTSYDSLARAFLTGGREELEQSYREWAVRWQGACEPDVDAMAESLKACDYSIHFNVWTLSGLLELLLRARSEFQLPLEIASVVSSENENIFILTPI